LFDSGESVDDKFRLEDLFDLSNSNLLSILTSVTEELYTLLDSFRIRMSSNLFEVSNDLAFGCRLEKLSDSLLLFLTV